MKDRKKLIKRIVLLALLAFAAWAIIPIFLDTEVNESAPDNTAVITSTTPSTQVDSSAPAPIDAEKPVERIGLFSGSNGYSASGQAKLIEDADGTRYVRFEDDFTSDNGPDLKVYIGTADDRGIDLGALKGNKGAQNYELPADIDPSRVDTIRIWCRSFSVDFGIVTL